MDNKDIPVFRKITANISAFYRKKTVIILLILTGGFLVLLFPSYFLAKVVFNRYFDYWGTRLVSLENRGLLSKEVGAAWQDVLATDAMEREAVTVNDRKAIPSDSIVIIDGIPVNDYPSLSIVARLNEVQAYSNSIRINDRKGAAIATIKTDHTRAKIGDFPPVLIKALVAAEDSRFYENRLGFEFDSFVRAIGRAVLRSITTFSIVVPKGTSTITQQVAKLFVSYLDETGQRRVSRSIDRKIRELRLSAALRKMYSADEILEVYLNHCIASDYGLIGVKDIAEGLMQKRLDALTDAECMYLARMVKWGRNIKTKIARQCRIDMPRVGDALGWSDAHRQEVLASIDTLSFSKPKQIQTESGHLVDLANEYWLMYIKKNQGDSNGNLRGMDLVNPNSLIRKKGDLVIQLTIDLPLQRFLEHAVDSRGFGPDTIIYTDVRIGSYGTEVGRNKQPRDTIRRISIIDTATRFSEPDAEFGTMLEPGDTLVTNIRYQKTRPGFWRRSCYYYARRRMQVDGQYFAYCILDSKSGKLLAYYSKDKIGSRLACLLRNRTPNGSSTAKPILNALNFDLGIFPAYARWSDSLPVDDPVPWERSIVRKGGAPHEVVFANSAVPGQGYQVHNHEYVFEGCQYIFDHLATSNNIFGVESVYRLNRKIFGPLGNVLGDAYPFAQFLYRLTAMERTKKACKSRVVTGVRLYKELARIVGVDVDTMVAFGRKIAVSDSLFSIALGTLEMTLYEQAHMFNMLYQNDLIERPAEHLSLVVDSIILNGVPMTTASYDTVKRYHPFADMNNIRPTCLGMHKRLVSNQWDGLSEYDVPYISDSSCLSGTGKGFSPDDCMIQEPLTNFAKSGTSDDVLRPFNADVTSSQRTNYGLWNATIRIDLSRLRGNAEPDERDITIACIGECNTRYTGARDGKTLHKFISRDLLQKAGTKCPVGFYRQYEDYLIRVTPDSVKNCGEARESFPVSFDDDEPYLPEERGD